MEYICEANGQTEDALRKERTLTERKERCATYVHELFHLLLLKTGLELALLVCIEAVEVSRCWYRRGAVRLLTRPFRGWSRRKGEELAWKGWSRASELASKMGEGR